MFFQRRDFIFSHIVVASLYWSTTAVAEDIIVPVKKGAAVPFDGQLFDATTALRWGLLLQDSQDKTAALIAREKGICTARLGYKDDLLKIQLEKDDVLIDDLKKRVLRADGARVKLQYELDHPAWNRTVWFGIGIGAITASALVIVGSQVF